MKLQFDTTADGRTLKILNVIDEFIRESLAIERIGALMPSPSAEQHLPGIP